MSTFADSIKRLSRSRPLTSEEVICFSAAASSDENRVLIDAAAGGMAVSLRVHVANEEGSSSSSDLGLVSRGTVLFTPILPPTSHGWLDHWVSYEVTNISFLPDSPDPIISLGFCAYIPSPPLGHENFNHSHGPELVMRRMPSHLVISLAPRAIAKSRQGKRRASALSPGKPSTPLSEFYDQDDDDEGEDTGAQKARLFKDHDGIVRSYQPQQVITTISTMTPFWRTMSLERIELLFPTNQGYSKEHWDALWLMFRGLPPLTVVDPDRAIMYRVAVFDRALVTTDPTLAERAITFKWKSMNWLFLSLFHFVRNPTPIADMYQDCGDQPRETIRQALKDWNLWMAIHVNYRFEHAWPSVREWLRDVPHVGDPTKFHHDGLHVRLMVEQLLFRLYTAITSASSTTNYGVSFADPDAVHLLMTTLDEEFVRSIITMNCMPHTVFRHPRTVADQVIGNPTLFALSTGHSSSQSSSTPSKGAPGSQPRDLCPYSLALLLSIPDSKGCSFRSNCPHSHPSSLAECTVAAASASAVLPKVKPYLTELLVAAISSHTNSFGPA